MFRALFRLIILLVVLVGVGAFFLGYRIRSGNVVGPDGTPVGTSGRLPEVDTAKARDTGAAIGEKVATGATAAQHALANASLTGKIKAKMTLDDTLKGADISVETSDAVVTLTGAVRSEAQHARALQLARETAGVTTVHDRLAVR
jgi:hypothetical protein